MNDCIKDVRSREPSAEVSSFFDDIMGQVEQEQAAMDSLGDLFGMLASLPAEEADTVPRMPGAEARQVLQDEAIFTKVLEEYGRLMEDEALGVDET